MSVRARVQDYVNKMASLLEILEISPIPIAEYSAVTDTQGLSLKTTEQLDAAIHQGIDVVLTVIDKLLNDIKQSQDVKRFVQAYTLVLWMDIHISYGPSADKGLVSLWPLLPFSGNEPKTIGALNDNYRETGIWINPRYAIIHGACDNGSRERALFNRDAFRRMNSRLKNCCYIRWDERIRISNIVIPFSNDKLPQGENLKIAFSPITDNPDPLNLRSVEMEHNGVLLRGMEISGLKDEKKIYKRFIASWQRACIVGAHIYFGPEMLGSEEMYKQNNDDLEFIVSISDAAMRMGLRPPLLTVMPSLWRNGLNTSLLAYQDGHILGKQKKNIPFVSASEGFIEALKIEEIREFTIIHLPGLYRIAVLLCAEFLPQADCDSVDMLCHDLGVNLIIVPSYSKGEQDFMNSLPSVRPYGTNVVWGDCCGAVKFKPRIIGGCAIAGTDYVGRMGSVCQCNNECKEGWGCLFTVCLPLVPQMDKPDSMCIDAAIEHILYPI